LKYYCKYRPVYIDTSGTDIGVLRTKGIERVIKWNYGITYNNGTVRNVVVTVLRGQESNFQLILTVSCINRQSHTQFFLLAKEILHSTHEIPYW